MVYSKLTALHHYSANLLSTQTPIQKNQHQNTPQVRFDYPLYQKTPSIKTGFSRPLIILRQHPVIAGAHGEQGDRQPDDAGQREDQGDSQTCTCQPY